MDSGSCACCTRCTLDDLWGRFVGRLNSWQRVLFIGLVAACIGVNIWYATFVAAKYDAAVDQPLSALSLEPTPFPPFVIVFHVLPINTTTTPDPYSLVTIECNGVTPCSKDQVLITRNRTGSGDTAAIVYQIHVLDTWWNTPIQQLQYTPLKVIARLPDRASPPSPAGTQRFVWNVKSESDSAQLAISYNVPPSNDCGIALDASIDIDVDGTRHDHVTGVAVLFDASAPPDSVSLSLYNRAPFTPSELQWNRRSIGYGYRDALTDLFAFATTTSALVLFLFPIAARVRHARMFCWDRDTSGYADDQPSTHEPLLGGAGGSQPSSSGRRAAAAASSSLTASSSSLNSNSAVAASNALVVNVSAEFVPVHAAPAS